MMRKPTQRGAHRFLAAAAAVSLLAVGVVTASPASADVTALGASPPTTISVGTDGRLFDPSLCDPTSNTDRYQVVSASNYGKDTCFRVLDGDGQPVVGGSVTVSVDKGFINATQQSTPTTTTKSVQLTTDSNGRAVAFVGSTDSGEQTITATLGSVSGTAVVDYQPGAPDTLDLTPSTATIKAGSSQTYQAKLADEFGNGIANRDVDFARTGPGLVFNSQTQGGASTTATTDASGVATVTLTTRSDDSGDGTLTASLGDISDTADYTVAGTPALTTVTAYVPNRTAGSVSYVGSHAYDQFGQPIAGQTLTFTVTGADPATGTAKTNSDGVAFFYFPVNHAGSISAKVSGPGGSPTASTTATVAVLPVKTTLTLSSPGTGRVDATATVSPVNGATVGQVVGFYQYVGGSNGQYVYKAQAKVNANGQATFHFTGLPSGSRLGYRAKIVGSSDVDSPFSPGAVVTVK